MKLFYLQGLQVLELTSTTQNQMDKQNTFSSFRESKPGGQSKQANKSKVKSRVGGTGLAQVDQNTQDNPAKDKCK